MTGISECAGGRIVVGVDGAASLTAVRWAAQEALLHKARVHLVLASGGYKRASYSGSPVVPPLGDDGADRRALLAAAELEAGRTLPSARTAPVRRANEPCSVESA